MKMDTNWGCDLTLRDKAKNDVKRGKAQGWEAYVNDCNLFYRLLLQKIDDRQKTRPLYHYLYERYGRPKWFVDNTVLDLLLTFKMEENDLSGIATPHDVFTFIFERGAKLGGFSVRSMQISFIRAKLSQTFLHEIGYEYNETDVNNPHITIEVDRRPWDTDVFGLGSVMMWTRHLREPENNFQSADHLKLQETGGGYVTKPLTDTEIEFSQRISSFVAAALMYAAARSDCITKYTLPRSCRYNFHGDKALYRRMLCPKSPVREDTSTDGAPTGRTVRGHYRGWVLRTLRAERYKRNPDGTFKVVLVEPCAVKGGCV